MKISIIGAGNVGGLISMRIAEQGLADTLLVDIKEGKALGKALDLEDSLSISRLDSNIEGTTDISKIKNSDIVIITAGLIRKKGQLREELLKKNAEILKSISADIKRYTPESKVLVVTNPVDILTYLLIKETRFSPKKVFGVGSSLDQARFSNLIAKELNVPIRDINSIVIGSHGEGMIPLSRFTTIKGVYLEEFLEERKIKEILEKTIQRGAEIVKLLEDQSAYFAPSQAVLEILKVIIKDEKKIIGLSCYLNGEYELSDICLGLPCRLGREGIEKIIELDLNREEKESLIRSAHNLKKQFSHLAI